MERWDVAFADLYLDALQAALAGRRPARPWDIAFHAPAGLPPLRHVLLGMNAHINYDLPQALLAVITDGSSGMRRCWPGGRPTTGRSTRCSLPGSAPKATSWPAPQVRPRRSTACSRRSTAGDPAVPARGREKVWANAVALNQARASGPQAYATARDRLAELSAAKVTALQAPGQVLLKLAATGFGVRLPG